MTLALLLAFATATSCGLTWVLMRYALSRSVVDVPNERSSHQIATPRGGGMAIVSSFCAGLVVFWYFELIDGQLASALLGAGIAVALIGFLDDHKSVPAVPRLLTHFSAASWVLLHLSAPDLTVDGLVLASGGFAFLVLSLYAVWLANLYNFMDGIDAIASIEALTVCLSVIALYTAFPTDVGEWAVAALLLAAVSGFLIWNYPPARVFMGDSGSGFLGITFAALLIRSAEIDSKLFWAWNILLAVFVTDSTVTLIRRGLRRERMLEAHRSHAYQRLARLVGSHRPVSLGVGAINLFWLLPIAGLVVSGGLTATLGMLISYVPLILLALLLGAGTREPE